MNVLKRGARLTFAVLASVISLSRSHGGFARDEAKGQSSVSRAVAVNDAPAPPTAILPYGHFEPQMSLSHLRLFQGDPEAASASELLRRLLARDSELRAWVLPHVRSYLQDDQVLPTKVFLGWRLPKAISSGQGAIYLDVGQFAGSDELAWNALVQELYLAATSDVGATTPTDPEDSGEVVAAVLAAIERRGMAAYVASQGRPELPPNIDSDVTGGVGWIYQALLRRQGVEVRFQELESAFIRLKGARPKAAQKIWRDLVKKDNELQIFAIAGASMAGVIERRLGREVLLAEVRRGPMAFYEAYQDTRPGALLNMYLPDDSAVPMEPPGRLEWKQPVQKKPLLSH